MHRLRAIFDVQFSEEAPQMNLDGVLADVQQLRHFSVAQPTVYKLQKLVLSLGKFVWFWGLAGILGFALRADQCSERLCQMRCSR